MIQEMTGKQMVNKLIELAKTHEYSAEITFNDGFDWQTIAIEHERASGRSTNMRTHYRKFFFFEDLIEVKGRPYKGWKQVSRSSLEAYQKCRVISIKTTKTFTFLD